MSEEENRLLNDYPEEKYSEVLSGDELVQIEGDVPTDINIPEGSDLLIISDDQSYLTHGVHSYPAKYIPELPRWAIQKYTEKGDVVFDPFSGSGTTNLEAIVNNRISRGTEIDWLAELILKVKTTPVEESDLRDARERIESRLENTDKENIELPDFHNRDHWFKKDVSKSLAHIKTSIEEENDEDIKDFYRICMSSIVRKVSNADNGSHKPCVRSDVEKNIPDPYEKFWNAVENNIKSMAEFNDEYPEEDIDVERHKKVDGDATDIKMNDESIDLAVTSPPYINALDYVRTHKLEYYWLGFATGSLADYKSEFVGTNRILKDEYEEKGETGYDELDEIIDDIYEDDKKRARVVYKYFEEDMKNNLKEVYRCLNDGGKYVLVVGNNTVRGHDIPNWRFIKKYAEDIGFDTTNLWYSGIINHYIPFDRDEKIDKDAILVLEK